MSAIAKAEAHKRAVVQLYRHSLKNVMSWCVMRDVFWSEQVALREAFEKNRNVEPALAAALLKKGQERLKELQHPDPYIIPFMHGGTKYQRSVDFPQDKIEIIYDYGREKH
mmetsp:Transcript_26645/g.32364  ORF Transcript_26645/g.32364 Transcript_26645/m.32364 type:complete len:111 (+) Transcript_26645:126-458(+)|eukprot:CAMPEP_0197856544 /NCGR_PEP_ID=MMETSP1438-20131217/28762_1 /TAXON_ID=1461541 /ORGANISM="Pterosperma sp., Strain CCMP1384" /LENGTH=110 /DNA_ID=CAMNT_0043472029 /DNA_START=125 /DNA_END=457 /DNA_ORIENTATION=+